MSEKQIYSADFLLEGSKGDETYSWARVKPPFVPTQPLFDFAGDGTDISHYVTVRDATILAVNVRPGYITEFNDTEAKRADIARAAIKKLLLELNRVSDLSSDRWMS